MNGRTLALFGVVGLAVAAYAVYTLSRPRTTDDSTPASAEADESRDRAVRHSARQRDEPDADPPSRPEPRDASTPSEPAAVPDAADAPEETELARRTRTELEELMERWDTDIADGREYNNAQWANEYSQGQALIHTLARELGSHPDAVEEIAGYHEDVRKKLKELQEDPTAQ